MKGLFRVDLGGFAPNFPQVRTVFFFASPPPRRRRRRRQAAPPSRAAAAPPPEEEDDDDDDFNWSDHGEEVGGPQMQEAIETKKQLKTCKR